MPTSLTSSFASAAAGGVPDTSTTRREGSSGNEWSRRINGAQTFRRPSTQTPSNNASGAYIPPHVSSQSSNTTRNGLPLDLRYPRDQLLEIYQQLRDEGLLEQNLDQVFTGPFDYTAIQTDAMRLDSKDQQSGPDICWSTQLGMYPLGLTEMSDAEKQLFSSSVNSPIKLNSKDSGTTSSSGRKTSLSTPYGLSSSTTSRPSTRRRETSESIPGNGPLSPAEPKTFFRNENVTNTPPPPLVRKKTDLKDEESQDESKEDVTSGQDNDLQSPFASLRRSGTGPSGVSINGPSSPWATAPQSSAFGSMGAFGNFGGSSAVGPDSVEKRPGFGSARSGSRLKDFLAKSSTEDAAPPIKEKSSFNALENLPEEDGDRPSKLVKNRPSRSETNPYDEGIPRSGSAALSGDGQTVEQLGFSPFNQQPAIGARDFGHPDSRVHQTPHGRSHQDAMSPTNTNPYQSPQARLGEEEEFNDDMQYQTGLPPFGGARRDVFGSSGAPSGFGSTRGMGGLSGLSTWNTSGFNTGNPPRDRPAVTSAFGDSVFSPISEIQSPGGSSAFGPTNFFGGPGATGAGSRPNRLGNLLPTAMQEHVRSDSRNDAFEGRSDSAMGRDPFDSNNRRSDGFRGTFEESSKADAYSTQSQHNITNPPGPAQRTSAGPDGGSQNSDSNPLNQMPAAQQRQMVMPDRMRWVYRDPHGNVQGPWSGLEMHDWFKAGFFTAELQVKKLEDVEYEPLAQLVRRIGNSREPFLVPQIGVPHGPSPANQGNPWSAGMTGGPPAAQPPFASSFPSFGTTLTAEQQNALERRKQEEQYLMARQKEYLAQRQMFGGLPQMSNHGMHSLHHHSSAHSLHSQPSFGSITSPGGYQASPMQGPIQPPQTGAGFGAPSSAVHPSREDELPTQIGRVTLQERTSTHFAGSPIGAPAPNQLASFQERERMAREMSTSDAQAHQGTFLGQHGRNERLEEFQELRGNMDQEEDQADEEQLPQPIGARRTVDDLSVKQQQAPIGFPAKNKASLPHEPESLSLTQQVQRTAAAHKQAAESDFIEPPPVSISPLPAPAAQRNRLHVADALAAESRSETETPVETPGTSIAPWAERSTEIPKGPSLKEIQEAETKRAAEKEALLMAARRAQEEQERLAAAQIIAPAPGLPSTSTWASSTSPGTPTTPGASVWAKPTVTKPASNSNAPKKTLAQIQKEEEARKQRAAAQAVVTVQSTSFNNSTTPSGSRYAQMASKVASAAPQPGNAAWTTVGSSGKPKTPATVVASPQTNRAVSTGSTAPVQASRPSLSSTRSTSVATGTKDKARDELHKWAKVQMGKGLNNGINVDDFVKNLFDLPNDVEVLSEAIYGNSQTLDGRRLADEFVRRRKLAERGIVDPNGVPSTNIDSKGAAGGWSEVAKKGPAKEEDTATSGFKVVSKKKGKR